MFILQKSAIAWGGEKVVSLVGALCGVKNT
jgi:hypothetical protein